MCDKDIIYLEKKVKFSKYTFYVGNFNLINNNSKTNIEIKSPTHKSRFFKNNEFLEKKDFSKLIEDLIKGKKK